MDADLQREVFLDHSQAPRKRGKPDNFDHFAEHTDPETGDEVSLWLCIEGAKIADVRWQAKGSSVLAASCSLMAESLVNKTVTHAQATINSFIEMLTGNAELTNFDTLGDAFALAGIRHLPARVRCASLPWRTAEQALKEL